MQRNGMRRMRMALAIILAMSIVSAACGESAQEAAGDESSEASKPAQTAVDTPEPEPAPTQAPTATPKPKPTPTQVPTATPKPEATPTQVPTATPEPEATQTDNASAETQPGEQSDVAEHLIEMTSRLWEVYNEYDIDALKAFYEENYWNEQEAEVRSNMQSFKNFGLKLNPEEPSPPSEIAPGKWEIRQTVSFTQGSIDMLFVYEEFAGEWLLTYAQDQ